MKNMQYNCYYSSNSVIVVLAIGQIPRSTERISSYYRKSGSLSVCVRILGSVGNRSFWPCSPTAKIFLSQKLARPWTTTQLCIASVYWNL